MNEIILLVPTIINTIAIFGVVVICLIELNTTYTKKRPLRRAQYILLMIGVMFSGFQPFIWATIPSLGTAIMSSSVLGFLIIHSMKRGYVYEPRKKV